MEDATDGADPASGPPPIVPQAVPGSTLQPPLLPPSPSPGPRFNPWIAICVRPRETMRRILDESPQRMVIALALLVGVAGAFTIATLPRLPEVLPRAAVALAGVLVAPLVSLLALFAGGFLVGVTGRWLEGTGDAAAVRAALAWSYVPALWVFLLFNLPQNLILGMLGGGGDITDLLSNPGLFVLSAVFWIIGLGLAVWELVIKMKCLGETHRFSAWRALGAYVLAWLIVLAVPAIPLVAIGVGVLLLRS